MSETVDGLVWNSYVVHRMMGRSLLCYSGIRHLRELEEAGLPQPAFNQIEVSRPYSHSLSSKPTHCLVLHNFFILIDPRSRYLSCRQVHPHLSQKTLIAYCHSRIPPIRIQAYCPLMRGMESKSSWGEGASWVGMKGMGWDSEVLKRLSAEVSCFSHQKSD